MVRGYINDGMDHYPGIVCECGRGWLPWVVETDAACPQCKVPFTTDPLRCEAAQGLSRLLHLRQQQEDAPAMFEGARAVAQTLDPGARELDSATVKLGNDE